jgi:hypothetical protein
MKLKTSLVFAAASILVATLLSAPSTARETGSTGSEEPELPPHIAKLYVDATEDTKRQGAYFGLIMQDCDATTGMPKVDDVLRAIFEYERDINSARYVEFLESTTQLQDALGLDGYCDFTIETTKGQLSRK